MKYTYNKLVRDKIPMNINKIEGRKANYKILNDDEYMEELNKKLFEEAYEFTEAYSVEELGDLMEVITSIMKFKNITMEQVEHAMVVKRNKKGGFSEKIYLMDVEQEQRDIKEEKELNKVWRKIKLVD